MKEKVRNVLIPLAFWLALWALAAAALRKELLLPSPWAVACALFAQMGTGAFWHSCLTSVGRILGGFGLGVLLGTGLGVVTARRRWCDRLFSPALRAVQTVPVVSFILLLFFWLPTGLIPTAVAALMGLPVVWRATRQGIAAADPALLEMAVHYRLSPWRTLRLARLPAALPAVAAGWETALGLCWKSGAAAEVLCQPKWGVGTQLQISKAYLDSPGLFAWTVVIVALSLGMEWLLRWAFRLWTGKGEA